jgi:excisionase family DNA binding protein
VTGRDEKLNIRQTEQNMTDTTCNATPDPMLSVDQVASELSVSTRTIRRLLAAGDFVQPYKIAGVLRFRRSEFLAWLQTTKGAAS